MQQEQFPQQNPSVATRRVRSITAPRDAQESLPKIVVICFVCVRMSRKVGLPPPPGLDVSDEEGTIPSANKPPSSAAREIGSADSDAAQKDSNGSDAQAKGAYMRPA